MLKTTSEESSLTNVRRSIETGNDGVNNSNKVNWRKVEENLSKINSSKARFLIPKARIALTHLNKGFSEVPILNHFDTE